MEELEAGTVITTTLTVATVIVNVITLVKLWPLMSKSYDGLFRKTKIRKTIDHLIR